MQKILKSYPLARRMMVIVILWSLIFTVLMTTIQIGINYQREIKLLNTRIEQIRTVEIPSLTDSIWHFDEKQIEIQLKGMLNLQDIRFVELVLVDGDVYSAGRVIPDKDAFTETLTLEYTQNGEKYSLGQLNVMADLRDLRKRVLGLLFIIIPIAAIHIFLLAGIILFVVELLLTRPLREIVKYAEKLDLDHLQEPLILPPRKLSSSGDELELVVLRLNEMRHRLIDNITERQQMEDDIRVSERNYREIFNATSEAIVIQELPSGRIVQVNNSLLRMYGYKAEAEVIGNLVGILGFDEPPYTQSDVEHKLQKALQEGSQIFEWLSRKKNGETFWVEVSLRSSLIGGEDRVLAVLRDITERKSAEKLLLEQNEALVFQRLALEKAQTATRELNEELEKRVEERTIQLAALNQELEAFSYSVAHDLRAPLRHINGFSQVILDEYGKTLNDDIINWIQRIQDSSSDLSQMVDALLELSRVTRDPLQYSDVALSDMVQKIADDLHKQDATRKIAFEIQPGLHVQVDARLIRSMLENLLGNAWKFSAHSQSAKIEFGCLLDPEDKHHKENEIRFYIRDNGVGFDMTYAERLFSPFQRLHLASEFPGTGIGLATVKRIIQRHGGQVWAEGSVNEGAIFYFSFPTNK